jgi:nucleoside 2-deoxyribosyltransferase
MKVYLASPFFNEREVKIYNQVINNLRSQANVDLFVPREHTIPNAWDLPNEVWAENVFAVDLLALQREDVVVVLNFGMYSDSGTAWECGYAYATGKTVINVLIRENKTEKENHYSLMMLNGSQATITLKELMVFGLEQSINLIGNRYLKNYEQK